MSSTDAYAKPHQVSIDEALAIIQAAVGPIARTEPVSLDESIGRVLVQDVVSSVDVPPFDRAAMDGYATLASGTRTASPDRPVILDCVGQLFAGHSSVLSIREGQCAAIATGARLPAGADGVVMIERARRVNHHVHVFEAIRPGEHVGTRGADIRPGQAVARSGSAISPGMVGALAAIGQTVVQVYARPRVAVVSTGEELSDPGRALSAGQLYDVNTHALTALVTAHGGVPHRRSIADCREDVSRTLEDCRHADVVVLSGGTSVGTFDFVVDIITQRGQVLFDGIAVKPGKSTAFGLVDGVPVLALPGYPTACLLNAYVLLVPLLRRLGRRPDWPRRVSLPLSHRVTSPRNKHHFSTVRIDAGLAVPVFKKAGDVTSISDADGYISLAPDVTALEAGTIVDITLF